MRYSSKLGRKHVNLLFRFTLKPEHFVLSNLVSIFVYITIVTYNFGLIRLIQINNRLSAHSIWHIQLHITFHNPFGMKCEVPHSRIMGHKTPWPSDQYSMLHHLYLYHIIIFIKSVHCTRFFTRQPIQLKHCFYNGLLVIKQEA